MFFLLPQEAFQGGNLLLPTLEGQYAFKNLVLIAAGLVIGSTVRRAPRSLGNVAREPARAGSRQQGWRDEP